MTLRGADGAILVERVVAPRPGSPVVGEIGFEAMSMFGTLHAEGHDPVDTTLTVTKAPADTRPSTATLYHFPTVPHVRD